MSDYIKREDAIKAYAETIKSDKDTSAIAEMILADVPSADVVEVRHGHWIDAGADLDGEWYYRCSVCGNEAVDGYEYPLCPYCGARMDGDNDE